MTEKTVLLVEDEAIIAMELADAFADAGWTVLGPAGTVPQAEAEIDGHAPRAAVLDMNLSGSSSLDLACTLQQRGVSIVFLTGSVHTDLPEALQNARVFVKPTGSEHVIAELERLLG